MKVCLLGLAGGGKKGGKLFRMSSPELSSPESRDFHRFFSDQKTQRVPDYFHSFRNAVAYDIFFQRSAVISLLTALKRKMWCLGDVASVCRLYHQLTGWITSKYFSSVPQFSSFSTCT